MRTVLGIQSVILPERVLSEENHAQPAHQSWSIEGSTQSARLIAVIPVSATNTELKLSPEARELLEKMIAAMKLPMSEVALCLSPQSDLNLETLGEIAPAAPIVIFGLALNAFGAGTLKPGEKKVLGGRTVFATYSPFELLRTPDLKRQAWTHLQGVMKLL